ncbi:MAG: histidinol-phosphate transaminase [Nitrososphaeria archaeon]
MTPKKFIAERLEYLGRCEYYPMEDTENVMLRMNINENFLIDVDALRKLAKEVLDNIDIRLYPNNENVELAKALSRYFNIGEDWFTVGCGEDQLIDLLLRIFAPGNKVVSIVPTFPVYRFRTVFNGGSFAGIPLNEDFSLDLHRLVDEAREATVTFICSPNNPTGNQFQVSDIERILSSVDGLVVVDEAYVDFAEYSVLPIIGKYDNLVVLRTFSKSFGLAGLRIGYMIADPRISRPISTAAQHTYPVVDLSTRMAIRLLEDKQIVEEGIRRLKAERRKLFLHLRSMGIQAFESQANFILFKSPTDHEEFYEKLRAKGIAIRDVGKIYGEYYFRVTVGTEDMNHMFVNEVKKIV